MFVLKARLAKLEARTGAARQIVVRSSQKMTDDEMTAFLASQDIATTSADMIVHMITIYEDDPEDQGSTVPDEEGNPWILPSPQLLAVTSIHRQL